MAVELPSIIQRIFVDVVGAEVAERKLKSALDGVDDSAKKVQKSSDGTQQSFKGMGDAAQKSGQQLNIHGQNAEQASKRIYAHNDAIKAGVQAHDLWGKALDKSRKATDDNTRSLSALGLATDVLTPRVAGLTKAHRDLESSELSVFQSHNKLIDARTKLEKVTSTATSTDKDRVRAVSDVRKAELGLVDALEGHRKKVSEVNQEQTKTADGMNILQKGLSALMGGAKNASEGFGGLISSMSILKGPGIIVGINLIVSALSALAGSAFSVISALGPLVGLLGAVPGAAIGLGSAFATVKLAFGDVTKAMKANTAQEGSTAASTKATAQAAASAAERVREATRSRDRAIESSAETIESAEERVQQAEKDAAQAVVDAADQIKKANREVVDAQEGIGEAATRTADMTESANRRVEDAEYGVVRAQRDAVQAQEDLTRARKDAAEALQQLAFQAQGDALSEESAQIRLIEAQQNYDQVMKSRASTDLDKRKAALDLHEAQLGLQEATDRNADTQAKLNDEQVKGVEGSDQVKSALQSQIDAAKGVADANQTLADAQKDQTKTAKDAAKLQADAQQKYADALDALAKTQIDANDKVAKANKTVEESEKSLAKARTDGADSVTEAEKELTLAIQAQKDQMASAGSVADKYKEALAKLSPEGRAFVTQLEAAQKQVETLKAAAQAGLLPGLTTALQEVTPLFPTLTGVLKDTGQALGDVAIQAGKLVASKEFRSGIAEIAKTNADAFRTLGGEVGPEGKASSGLIGIIDAFRHVAVEAQFLIKWIAELGNKFGTYIDKAVIAGQETGKMHDFFQRAVDVATQLGHIIGNVVGALYNMGKAASTTGQSFLDKLETITGKWKDWTGSLTGQNRLKEFFESTKGPMEAFGHLIGDLAKGLGSLADPGSLTPLINAIDKQLLPPLLKILNSMQGSDFGPQLINLLEQILKLASQFAGTSGPLGTYITMLTELTKILNWMTEHIPGMREVIFLLTTGFAANKALSTFMGPFKELGILAGRNTGLLGGFANEISFLPGKAGAAEGAMGKLGAAIGRMVVKAGEGISGLLSKMGLFKKGTEEAAMAAGQQVLPGFGGGVAGAAGGAAGAAAAGEGALLGGGAAIGGVSLITVAAIAAAVVALIAGIVLLYQHWKPFHDLVDATWQGIQDLWDLITSFLGDTVSNVAQWGHNVGGIFAQVWDGVTAGARGVGNFLSTVWDGVIGAVVAVKDTIVGAWNDVWGALSTAWEAVGQPVLNVILGVFNLTFGLIAAVVKDTFEIISHLWDVLAVVFEGIGRTVTWLAKEVFAFSFGWIKGEVELAFKGISLAWDVLSAVFDKIGQAVGWLRDAIFQPAFDHISGSVSISFGAISSAWDWLRTNVFDRVASAADTLRGLVADAFGKMQSAVSTAFGAVSSAWDTTMGRAMGAMRTMFEWVRDNAAKIWGGLSSSIAGAFSGLVNVVRSAIGPVASVIGTVADAIGGILTAVGLNNVGGWLKGVGSDLKGFAAGRESGGRVPAAEAGQGPYDKAPMVEVGPGFVTAGVRAIVGEGNPAYPEYVIPTDPRYRKRATGLFGQLGKALEVMAAGGRVPSVPAAAIGLSSLPGAGVVKNIVGGVVGGITSAWDWTKGLAAGAWRTGTGLLRKGAGWALEHAWPTMGDTGVPLVDIVPRGMNAARAGVVGWVKGNEDPGSPPIAVPGGGVGGMAAGGRVPRYAGGGRVRRGGSGGGIRIGGYRVRGFADGGGMDSAGAAGWGGSGLSDMGLKVALRAAFDAMADLVSAGQASISDGLTLLHVDLAGGVAAVGDVEQSVVGGLSDGFAGLLSGLKDHLNTTIGWVTKGLSDFQAAAIISLNEVVAKIGGVLDELVRTHTDILAAVNTVVTTLGGTVTTTIGGVGTSVTGAVSTLDTNVGTGLGNLPANIAGQPNIAGVPIAVAQVAAQTIAGVQPSLVALPGATGAAVGANVNPAIGGVAGGITGGTTLAAVDSSVDDATTAFKAGPPKTKADVLATASQIANFGGKFDFADAIYLTPQAYNKAVSEAVGLMKASGTDWGVNPNALTPQQIAILNQAGQGNIPRGEAGGVFSVPTMIVGEGDTPHPEYVVPTDPRHRRRAYGLFSQLAGDLGVQTLAGGGVMGISGASMAAGNLAADANRMAEMMTRELQRQTAALEELVQLTRKGAGKGVTFESGAFQMQGVKEEKVADSIARKMQMLASVGAFGGAGGVGGAGGAGI